MAGYRKASGRQEQILEAALHLFAVKGFDRTTIDDIADACGIAPGLIYHYFDSKADLLQAVLHRHGFLPTLRRILQQPPRPTLEATLTEIADAYLSLLEKHREFALVIHGEMHRDEEVARLLGKMAQEGLHLMLRYLLGQVEVGKIRRDVDLEVVVWMFFGALIEFFLAQNRLCPPLKRIAPKHFVREMVAVLVGGLEIGEARGKKGLRRRRGKRLSSKST